MSTLNGSLGNLYSRFPEYKKEFKLPGRTYKAFLKDCPSSPAINPCILNTGHVGALARPAGLSPFTTFGYRIPSESPPYLLCLAEFWTSFKALLKCSLLWGHCHRIYLSSAPGNRLPLRSHDQCPHICHRTLDSM